MQNFYKFLKVSLLTLLAFPALAQTVTVTNNTPTICSGDDGEVNVVVTGGAPPYIVTYSITDGGVSTVTTNNVGDVTITLPSLTTNPNDFEVTSVEDDNNIVTPITTNNTAQIEVIDNPAGTISLNPGFDEVCEGENVEVLVTMSAGEAPFDIVISINGTNTNHTINSLSEVVTFSAVAPNFTIGSSNGIKLESASYTKNGATCSSVISGPTQNVLVKAAPSAVIAFDPSINSNPSGSYCESDLITSEVTFTSFGTPSCNFEILVDGGLVTSGNVTGISSGVNTYTAQISHTLNSLANPSATLEIRLTGNISANNGGEICTAPTAATTGPINVFRLPDVDMTDFSNDICNGDPFDVTTTRLSGIGTINYDYTYNGATQSSSFAGASEVIVGFPYVVGDEEIVLVKVSDDNCDAFPGSVQGELTVLDRPTATINTIEGVCVDDATTFTIDFTGTPDFDFVWEIQDAGNATVAGPFSPTISTLSTTITIDPVALGLASGITYTFVATSLNDDNCIAVPATDFNIQEFDFEVYDLPDVTVVFDQTQVCGQGGNVANIDDVLATFTFTNGKVPFTLKYNESVVSNGDTTTTLVTDVVTSVNGAFEYTKAFSPNDTTIYSLVSVVDSNGCELAYPNPLVGLNQVAQVDVKDVPTVVVTNNTSAVCEDGNLATALTQINFHAEFTGSGSYELSGEVRDEVGTLLGTFNFAVPVPNNGILDVTLADIEAATGLTFTSATDYQVVFTQVRDDSNSPVAGFPSCDYAIVPEQLFTVHVIPTPTFVSVTSNDPGIPNRLCKGESSTLSFTFGGLYDYLFTLSKEDVASGNITLIGEKLKITNGSSLGGDTIYPFNISPTAQTRYFINEIFLAYEGDTCSVVPVGAEITIDVDSLPILESFSLDKSTICVGEDINVSAEFSGLTPPANQFDFDLFLNNTFYNSYTTGTTFGPENIPSAFLTDTSYFSIRNLRSVSGEQCNADEPLDSIKLNVNQLVDGEILTNKDTVFCFDQPAGFYVELSGYDNVNVTFSVADEDGNALPNVIESFVFANTNYSTQSYFVAVPGLPTGTALTYTIASMTDGNSPSCINAGPFPEAAHLIKNIQPVASLTGPMSVCPGEANELDLMIQAGAYFTGGHNHRVTVASEVSYINGGVLTANTRINIDTAGITYKVPFSINSDTTFVVTQIEDQFGCTADLSGVNWSVDVIDSAKVTLSAFDTICSGSDVDVIFNAEQSGIDYDVTIEINGGAPINETIQDGDIIPYTLVDGDNIIVITTSGYGAGPACTITLNDTLSVFQKPSPVAIITNTFTNQKVCEGDDIRLPLEVTAGQGVVTVEISDNLNIAFNATIDIVAGEKDTLDISGLPIGNYDFYISNVTTNSSSGICNGTGVPSDASFVIEQSPSATFTTSDPDLVVCSGELINFDVVISPQNAADYRIIYNINGGTDDTVVVNVGSPSFLLSFTENSLITFTSIEEIGVTPACSGTLTSDNQFNFTVNPRPSVALSGDTDVCEEVGASLNLDFEGTAPFIIDIDNGVGTFTASQDTTITVFPSSTVTYQVVSLTDASTANCATAGALPSHMVNVVTKPDVYFATSDSTVCDGQKVDLLFNIDNTGIVGSTGFNIRYKGVSGTVSTLTGVSTDDDIVAVGVDTLKTSEALNGNQIFTLVSIEDGSNPRCTFNYNEDILVEVGEGIDVDLTAFDTEVCEGDNVDLQAIISGTTGKQVVISVSPINGGSFIDTVSANSTVNISDLAPAAGTINYVVDSVKYLTEAFCKIENAVTEQVVVNPAPDASIAGNYTICDGQTASIDLEILAGSGDVTVSFSTSQGDVFDYTGTVGSHTVNFTPTSSGSVSVVITNVVSSTPGAFCNNTAYTGGTATVEVRELPTATIDADQTTIVNGGTANLIFDVSGPGNLDDVSVEYAINASGGNFVDDGTPNTVIPNATYQQPVSPIVTSTYSIVAVRQGAAPTCVTMPTDQVTINVVSGVVAAVSGTGSICQGESVEIVFSFADNTKDYTVIVEDQNGNQKTFTGVTDNTPETFIPSQTGSLNFNIISVVSDDNSVNTQDPGDFDGAANYNVSSQKTITMYGDTIGCEGQNLPVFFEIEGSGDFTITFRNRSVSGVSRTFTASENDSPVQIFLTPSELRLGLNEFDFSGVKVTNSLGNTCPIDTAGSATIFVKPTPSANVVLNPAEVCAGSPVSVELQLTPDSTFNVFYRVDSANTSLVDTAKLVSNGGLIANFTPTQDVRYTVFGVEYADLPKCRNNTIVSKELTVTPEPEAEFTSFDANICAGEEASITVRLIADKYPVSFILNDGSTNSTYTVYNANAASDTTIKVSPVTPTTYTIHTVIDGNTPACTGNNIVSIDIDVSKTIIFNNFDIIPDSICSGDPAVFNIDVDGEFPITGFMSDGTNSFTVNLTSSGPNSISINPTPFVTTDYTLLSIQDNTPAQCNLTINEKRTLTVRSIPQITIIPDANEICLGDSLRIRVIINAENDVDFNLRDQDPANGFDVTYTDIPPGTQFIYIHPKLNGINTFSVDSIYYSDGKSCANYSPEQFSLQANPKPFAFMNVGGDKDTTVCEGQPVAIDFFVGGTGTKTVFYGNDRGFNGSFVHTGNPNRTILVNPYPEVGDIKYFIQSVTSQNGIQCDSTNADTVLVRVSPIPTVEITADLNPRCLNEGAQTNLTFNFNGNGPFEFDYTDGLSTFKLNAISDNDGDGRPDITVPVSPGQTTTYQVTRIEDATNPFACVNNTGNAFTLKVLQSPEAEIFNNNNVICEGESILLEFFLRGKGPLDIVIKESTGTTFPLNGLSPGYNTLLVTPPVPTAGSLSANYSYIITSITDANNPTCSATGTGAATVLVNTTPELLSYTLVEDSICLGESINIEMEFTKGFGTFKTTFSANGLQLTDTVNGIPTGGTNYEGSITTTPVVDTEYRPLEILDLATGCASTYSPSTPGKLVKVFKNPTATFNILESSVCDGDDIHVKIEFTGEPPFTLDGVFLNGSGTPVAGTNSLAVKTDNDGDALADTTIAINTTGVIENSYFTFGHINDGRNLNGRGFGCSTTPDDTLTFTVNPTPTATIGDLSTITVCEGDTATFPIDITGNGEVFVLIDISKNGTYLRTDSISGFSANSPLTYADQTVYSGVFITYEISEVYAIKGNLRCDGTAGTGTKTINYKAIPRVSINLANNTVCEDDATQVDFTFTGIGGFDFYYVMGDAPNQDTVEFFNEPNFVTDFINFTDSTVLYVPFIQSRSNPQCINTDSVGVNVDVNKKATATFVDPSIAYNYCEGEQPGFFVDLTGEGLITVQYRAQPSGTIGVFQANEGTHFVPVNQFANTSQRYRIENLSDESNPFCVSTNFPDYIDINVYPRPQATLSGDFDACFGETSTVNIALTGSFQDSIIVYFSDKLNGVIDTSFAAKTGVYSMPLAPTDSVRLTIDSIAYVNLGCMVTDPTLINQDTAIINIRPTPTVDISIDNIDQCVNADLSFVFDFEYDGPYNISYRINGGSPINDDDVDDGHIALIPNVTDSILLEVTSLSYRTIPFCTADDVGSLFVNVNDSLRVDVTDTLCTDVATGFGLELNITGGQPSTYLYNEFLSLNPVDTTPFIPNGPFNILISDSSGCPPVRIIGDHTCDCISFAGTFNDPGAPIELCEDALLDLTAGAGQYQNDFIKDANDTLIFVIHDNNGPTLGNIFATSPIAQFSFAPGMVPGLSYYVTAVVADSVTGGGFDNMDRCLSLSNNIEVIFLERSTLEIELLTNDSGAVCIGDDLSYRFRFDGTGPFDVSWIDGTGPQRTQTFVAGVSPNLTSNSPVSADDIIDIQLFVDNGNPNNCYTILNDNLPYVANPLPDANFTPSALAACGYDTVEFVIDNPVATTRYFWTFEGGLKELEGASVKYAFTQDGPGIAEVTAISATGCESTEQVIIAITLPQRPLITIDNQDPTSPSGIFCRQDVLQFVANATLFDKIEWVVDGASVKNTTDPTYTPAAFDRAGIYQVVAVNEYNGCFNSDTATFEIQGPSAGVDVPDPICVDTEGLFSLTDMDDVAGATWSFSGTTTDAGIDGISFNYSFDEGFPSNDRVDVSLTLRSTAGCKFDTLFDITVYDLDVQLQQFNDQNNALEHCAGIEDRVVPYTATSPFDPDINSLLYDFGDGQSEAKTNLDTVYHTYNVPGDYIFSVTVQDINGCVDTDSLKYTIFAKPNVQLDDDSSCFDNVFQIVARGADRYEWSPLDAFEIDPLDFSTALVRSDSVAEYQVQVIGVDGNECRDTAIATIKMFDLLNPINNPKLIDIDTTHNIGYELSPDYELGDNRYIYTWADDYEISCLDCPLPTMTNLLDTTYVLTVTDIYGCYTNQISVKINLNRESSIDVPDAFTPNGDGVNDWIYPDGWAFESVVEFSVYNRYGQLVWKGEGTNGNGGTASWDGTFKGKTQANDTYTYRAVIKTILGTEEIKTGSFEIIKADLPE